MLPVNSGGLPRGGLAWCTTECETNTFSPTPPPLTYPTSSHLPHLLSPTPPPLTYPTSSYLPHLLSPTPPPLTYPTPLTSASPYPKALTTFVYNDSSVNPPQPSRVVCGQSPRTCLSPASNPPQTWDQNIVNWPVGGAVAGGWGCGRWVWVQLASNAIDSACG